jgi:hypothetical protein
VYGPTTNWLFQDALKRDDWEHRWLIHFPKISLYPFPRMTVLISQWSGKRKIIVDYKELRMEIWLGICNNYTIMAIDLMNPIKWMEWVL